MRNLFCVAFTLVSLAWGQDAGPFGLRAGMTRKQVELVVGTNSAVSQDGDAVTYSTVPHPLPLFEQYVLVFSRNHGLVMIQAISSDIDDDESGRSTNAKCEDASSALSDKYGKPKPSLGCRVKANVETCKQTSGSNFWEATSPRADKVEAIELNDFLIPVALNEQGKYVTAGCPDVVRHAARWRGTVTVTYILADYSKYQDEIRHTL